MKKIVKATLISTILSASLFAQNVTETNIENEAIVKSETTTTQNSNYSTYEIGASKITLGDMDHKAIRFTGIDSYAINDDLSFTLVGESNYYRHLGDINDIGLVTLGLNYDVPFTSRKLTIGASAGLGMSWNYNRMFSDFSKSFDFGFAYRANIAYNINESWAFDVSYSKFDFNTNATQLEDTKPEIISAAIVYKFDMLSLLD